MKVAIHQPNYLPWLGYFYKMALCDVFIILDTVQFTKNSYQNRVKIKTSQGEQWLTQPVRLADGAFKLTNEMRFADKYWGTKHIKTLQANYGKAKYFKTYFPMIRDILESTNENFSEFNFLLLKALANVLNLKCLFKFASDYPSGLTSTKRLVELVEWVGGDVYVSGKGGENYQDTEEFHGAGIKVEVSDFEHPIYPQLWGDFAKGLSIVDLLFNCGNESMTILLRKS